MFSLFNIINIVIIEITSAFNDLSSYSQ